MKNFRLLSCLAVLALAAAAFASSLGSRYSTLLAHVQARYDAIPTEGKPTKDQKKLKAELTAALADLNKDSTTLESDLALAAKALKALNAAGLLADATIGADAGGLADGLQTAVLARIDLLKARLSDVPAGAGKTKAMGDADKAESLAAAASDAGDAYAVVKGLEKAMGPLKAGEKLLAKLSM